jgi:hypothetical protein
MLALPDLLGLITKSSTCIFSTPLRFRYTHRTGVSVLLDPACLVLPTPLLCVVVVCCCCVLLRSVVG